MTTKALSKNHFAKCFDRTLYVYSIPVYLTPTTLFQLSQILLKESFI